jgi:hypothetical protein
MPKSAASAMPHDVYERISALLDDAEDCLAPGRADAIREKWMAGIDVSTLSGYGFICAVADSVLMADDLLLSQPSASGATAFDRLARRPHAEADAALLRILQRSRFRVLDTAGPAPAGGLAARDPITGENLRITAPDLATVPAGTALFARVAIVQPGIGMLAGTITPLDKPALDVARRHSAAGALAAFANARWAEAVYRHVVRTGTLDVPGLNRPSEDFGLPGATQDDLLDAADDPLAVLAREWLALGTAQPGADLLHRTRLMADQHAILVTLDGAIIARDVGKPVAHDVAKPALAAALERMLLTFMETVLRRENAGSSRLSLDGIADTLAAGIAAGRYPSEARSYFAALRRRLTGGAATRDRDDPDLARLIQRIQGLRAKTVEQGCTEQEALAAAEKVAELLDRYGLALGELDFSQQTCSGIGVQTGRRRFAPIDKCIPVIAEFFDCRVWSEQAEGETLRYVFFGLRADVTAAEYLYALVERAFETETNAFRAGELYARMAGVRRSATNSFQIGLSATICAKLRGLRQARETRNAGSSGRDLVPLKAAMVENELARLGLNLHTRGIGGSRHVLTEAYKAGEEAGNRFEVTAAITRAA